MIDGMTSWARSGASAVSRTMVRAWRGLPLGASWVALAACGHSANATAAPESAHARTRPAVESPPQTEAPDRAEHMQATFWMAVAAREAVIAGNLEGAHRAAKELAEYDYGALPPNWKHWVAQLQQRADETVLAPDLTAAAQSVAALALACGDCHAQMRGAKPLRTSAVEWKDPPDDLDERMLRHERGIDQLWMGLVQPSESAWRDGTVTLTRAPLSPPEEDGQTVDPALAERIEAIRELARRARGARSHPERAAVYGEMLARCASCHYAVRPAGR